MNQLGLVTAVGLGRALIVGAAACCGADTVEVRVGQNDLHPNEPSGMTVLGYADGSVAQDARGAFGIERFGSWYWRHGGSMNNVYVVDDPGNPTGSGKAVRLDWIAGTSGEAGLADMKLSGDAWRTVYIMHRVYIPQGYPTNFGHKWFYFLPSGARSPGECIWTSSPSFSSHYVNDPYDVGAISSYNVFRPGAEYAIEYLFVAESAPRAGDGKAYVWINGAPQGSYHTLRMASDNQNYTADWDILHYYAKAGFVPEGVQYDVREVYVSAKK